MFCAEFLSNRMGVKFWAVNQELESTGVTEKHLKIPMKIHVSGARFQPKSNVVLVPAVSTNPGKM